VKNFILALLLFQNSPQPVGVVTGVVNGPNGMPASGVRVFAIEARDGIDPAKTSLALESISVTDDKGRYRLEIATGRYYIASGSVEAPTFSPGTSDVAAAREVRVTAGSVVANVDFSSFVPPLRTVDFGSALALPPGSTGVLEGVLHYADGTPASGIVVTTVPSPLSLGPVSASSNSVQNLIVRYIRFRGQARSDANGRYRIPDVSPGTYYIAAGIAEAPEFYPGTSDILAAKTITTIPTTNLAALDFTVSKKPLGIRISGRVTATGGAPAAGATVQIQNQSPASQAALASGLPSNLPQVPVPVGVDGRMEFLNVLPGTYVLQAGVSAVPPVSKSIVVADQPVDGIEIPIPVASFSGRIVMEDGSAFPDAQVFGQAIVTTVNNPYLVMSTIMPISTDGTFSRLMEPDEYRFSLRTLPEGYRIRSVTAGEKNLLRDAIKVGETGSIIVEIRVARKDDADSGDVRLSGKALDAVTGAAASAELVTICCRESGISQRFSTPLHSDGSFEFAAIPPGHYNVGLQVASGRPNLFVVDSGIDVDGSELFGIEILSAQRFIPVLAYTGNEAGDLLNTGSAVVVFVGTSKGNRVVATRGPVGIWSALLPAGDVYTPKIENLPAGFSVKSTSGPLDFRTLVPAVNPIGAPPPDPIAHITLSTP
jgi:protocatechuate 3,4-dioxygenase beta subunit